MIYACCDERRRAAVLGLPSLNGIDYLEVLDHDAPADSPRQQSLFVHCLKPAPTTLEPSNVLITGGERITGITAVWIAPADAPPANLEADEIAYFEALPEPANVLVVRTSVAGDFSPYTLRLVESADQAAADPFELTESLEGFDPQLTAVTFSFKVECGPDFDCGPPVDDCPPELPAPPPIDYLAKDYSSFRTILLDRLNQLLPSWDGTSEADIGVMLAELIASIGDGLSYRQDAVATEAYLLTARSRVSLRRHALLVDYRVHEGCNARTWMRLTVSAPVILDQASTRFSTFAPGIPTHLSDDPNELEAALRAGVVVFEPMQGATLRPEHNELHFYTWGDSDCCLPKGATEATLAGSFPELQIGDVLVFQEVLGPETGVAADADLRRRCAVRLTSVATTNGRGEPLVDPLFEDGSGAPITDGAQLPTPVTEIRWSTDDALPFPLCVSSSFLDSTGGVQSLTDVSVAYGNVVLADHGLTMPGALLGPVPGPTLFHPATGDHCDQAAPSPFPVRFRPVLPDRPVTQAVPLPLTGSPVTPAPVVLSPTGWVSLADANGATSLMVGAEAPSAWPQFFGIVASANASTPDNFDLAVVYAPPGGPPGVTGTVVLERFENLTLAPGPANAIAQLDSRSRFVSVPAGFVPPAANPTTFPPDPAMLPDSGTFELEDGGGESYLTLQPTPPLSWRPGFAILAQDDLSVEGGFNLVLVYEPPTGAVGVQAPVVVEEFDGLSLETAAATIAADSHLIAVRSFLGEPNPILSAAELTQYDADEALPVLTLQDASSSTAPVWTAAPDLLAAGPDDILFVVEIEADGTARLRFGDDTNGAAPRSGVSFAASYRVGNGAAGNVGADSLTVLTAAPRIQACTNPLPASGGSDPETSDQIRRRAPQAFMTQERAVTMLDYASAAEQNKQIEDAVATLRWTGSWYTADITAEPWSGGALTPQLRKSLVRTVDRFRLAGEDVMIEDPDYVPLELELTVCVDPSAFRSDVQRSLGQVLGTGSLPGGGRGFFAPGRFRLGETVYLSPIYRAARAVAGVQRVTATTFQPQGVATDAYLRLGEIPLGPTQVARMANDPSLPDHGRLTLVMEGGK